MRTGNNVGLVGTAIAISHSRKCTRAKSGRSPCGPCGGPSWLPSCQEGLCWAPLAQFPPQLSREAPPLLATLAAPLPRAIRAAPPPQGVFGGSAAFSATLISTSSLGSFARASNVVLEVGMPVSGSKNAAGARLALLRSFAPYTAYEALSVQAFVATTLLTITTNSCAA